VERERRLAGGQMNLGILKGFENFLKKLNFERLIVTMEKIRVTCAIRLKEKKSYKTLVQLRNIEKLYH